MKHLFTAVMLVFCLSTGSHAAFLVYSDNGNYVEKPSLYKALTDTDTTGKLIVNTTANASLTVSNVTLSGNRKFECRNGGYLNPASTYKLSGLRYAEPEWYGINTIPGTTDMSLAISSAILAAKSVNFVDNYSVASAIIITKKTRLYSTNGATISMATPIGYIFNLTSSVDGVEFDGLTLDGRLTTYNDTIPIGINSSSVCYNITVKNCTFKNFGYGIGLVKAETVKVQNNIFMAAWSNVAKSQGGHAAVFAGCLRLEITDNIVGVGTETPSRHGFYLAHVSNSDDTLNQQVKIRGNKITVPYDAAGDIYSSCLELFGFSDVIVTDNILSGGYNAVINVTPARVNKSIITIANNYILDSASGIRFGAFDDPLYSVSPRVVVVDKVTITNNTVAYRSGTTNFTGVTLKNFKAVVISGNNFVASGGISSLAINADNSAQTATIGTVLLSGNTYTQFIAVGRQTNCISYTEHGAVYLKPLTGAPVLYGTNIRSYNFTAPDLALYTLSESVNGVGAISYYDNYLFSNLMWHPYFSYWVNPAGIRVFGTTAQRPTGSIATHTIYYDTTSSARLEWNGTSWVIF